MQIINHQLKQQIFYFPFWEVKHLFIGTFNPEGGEKVTCYFGRHTNQTWRLISKIFCEEFNPYSETFFRLLEKHKIACVDMIDHLKASDNRIERIIGKGYKDSEIINGSVQRFYNTIRIQNIIEKNPTVNIYSTWGKGSNLKEWRDEIEKLGGIISLVSPSMAAKVPEGVKKFDYLLEDWRKKVKHLC